MSAGSMVEPAVGSRILAAPSVGVRSFAAPSVGARSFAAPSVGVRSFAAIGTICHVLTSDEAHVEAAVRIVKTQLAELDAACSRFRDDSELMSLEQGRSVAISPLLTDLLAAALRTARRTDGLVDPTVGLAMIDLGYDDDLAVVRARRRTGVVRPRAPREQIGPRHSREQIGPGDSRDQIRFSHDSRAFAPRPVPGYWRIVLDYAERRVIVPRGTHLDLGASAKAWAADRAARTIEAELGVGVLVNLGGDLAVRGPAPRDGWQVAIDDATDPDATAWPVVAIRTGGLATSSTAVRTWRQGDRELHHIVDPRTGDVAPSIWRAVTVAAESAELANAAATAAIILGPDAASWLVRRGLPARLVSRSGLPVYVGDWPVELDRRSA